MKHRIHPRGERVKTTSGMRDQLTSFVATLRRLWTDLVDAIVEARKGPKRDPNAVTFITSADDPLVTSKATGGEANPLPLSRMPIRSEKADAKRAAHAYAERRAGHPLSWKAARRLLNQWERLDREQLLRSKEIHAVIDQSNLVSDGVALTFQDLQNSARTS